MHDKKMVSIGPTAMTGRMDYVAEIYLLPSRLCIDYSIRIDRKREDDR